MIGYVFTWFYMVKTQNIIIKNHAMHTVIFISLPLVRRDISNTQNALRVDMTESNPLKSVRLYVSLQFNRSVLLLTLVPSPDAWAGLRGLPASLDSGHKHPWPLSRNVWYIVTRSDASAASRSLALKASEYRPCVRCLEPGRQQTTGCGWMNRAATTPCLLSMLKNVRPSSCGGESVRLQAVNVFFFLSPQVCFSPLTAHMWLIPAWYRRVC